MNSEIEEITGNSGERSGGYSGERSGDIQGIQREYYAQNSTCCFSDHGKMKDVRLEQTYDK